VEPFAQKSFLDVGRATYAEMLYRTNLIAYVPADHVTGLPSNVGKERNFDFVLFRLNYFS
jgi:hypothetical protein